MKRNLLLSFMCLFAFILSAEAQTETNQIANGIYFIKDASTGKYLTKNTTATPTFEVANVNFTSQRWVFTKDVTRYKITCLDGAPTGYYNYINENGKFPLTSANAYLTAWNSMTVIKNTTTGNFAIQKGGSAGSQYWSITDPNLTTANATSSEVFLLARDYDTEFNTSLTTAIDLRDNTQLTSTDELGKYPQTENTTLANSISTQQTNFTNATTDAQRESALNTLNASILTYQNSYLKQTNQLVDGIYQIKAGSLFFSNTGNSTLALSTDFEVANGTNPSLQQFYIEKQTNGRYKITCIGGAPSGLQNYINEGGNFGSNAYSILWNTMQIHYNGSGYAIQQAQSAGTEYWVFNSTTNKVNESTYNGSLPSEYPFNLVFLSTLPVTLTDFNITKENNGVVLNWTTSSEINNDYYEISRSNSNTNFEVIETISAKGPGTGSQLYKFTDTNPLKGSNYYKLNQIDKNGVRSDLGVRFINFAINNSEIQIYPNPVTNGVVNISGLENTENGIQISIFNLTGAKVWSQYVSKNSVGGFTLKIGNDINPGHYLLKIGNTKSLQLVIQ